MTGSRTFDRRGFLALGALAGVAACTRNAPSPATSAASAAPAAPPSVVSAASSSAGVDLTGLAKALQSPLIRPGDSRYAVAAQPYNRALGVRKPAAIAQVATPADVRTCVQRAGGRGIPLAARSGGHSYAGYSTPDGGLVVDLGALKSVTVKSDGTAVVGAGARLIDVYAALAAQGRAIPAGSCPTVGVGGSTLGGGIGVVSRSYGLTCDHLKSATVVTADGALTTVDAGHDADLFWALRGGGGGNGAIVTDFTFTTVPAPSVTIFSLHFPAASTARVLRSWSAWIDAAPKQLTALCAVTAAATPTNRVTGTWTGATTGLAAQLSALVSAVGATPTSRFQQTYGYLDAMKYFASCLNKTVAACHPVSTGGTLPRDSFRAASRMLQHTVTTATADGVVGLMRKQSGMVLLFDSLGGAVAQPTATETAFVHRTAHGSVQIYSGSASSEAAVTKVQNALAPIVGTGSYVNYLNPGQTDWATAYYGANLPRLRSVIRQYDPQGVFTFQQSVLRA